MVGKNVLKTQLQTGTVDKPSIASSAKESGAMSITLMTGEDKLGDENKMELHTRPWKVNKSVKVKTHEGTQTDIFKLTTQTLIVRD